MTTTNGITSFEYPARQLLRAATVHTAYELYTIGFADALGKFTAAELRMAFDAVCDRRDWKAPIRARISSRAMRITKAAITFFQGTVPQLGSISASGRRITISSQGYIC